VFRENDIKCVQGGEEEGALECGARSLFIVFLDAGQVFELRARRHTIYSTDGLVPRFQSRLQPLLLMFLTCLGALLGVAAAQTAQATLADPVPGQARLTFNKAGSFKIVSFHDLHYGEVRPSLRLSER
jgi:hypothetical protein